MYPGTHAGPKADQPAFIMAQSGETVTYAELEARTNRLAHFLRNRGLKRLDHYAIFMENNARYLECCGAGERAGLYFTCINSFLTAQELAYTRMLSIVGLVGLVWTGVLGGRLVFQHAAGIPSKVLQAEIENRAERHEHGTMDSTKTDTTKTTAPHTHSPGTPPHSH